MSASYGGANSEYDDDLDDELNEHWHDPGDPDGVIAEENRHKEEQGQPKSQNSQVPDARHHKSKRIWKIIVGLVLLTAAAFGAYWIGSRQATPSSKKSTGQTVKHDQPAQTVSVPTTHYDSTTYGIGINYPNNWVVSDTAQQLAVTSPNLTMDALSGKSTGHVIVTIQNQQSTIAGFPTGGAIASLESDKLTYAQPTSVQRAQTYLSYLSYSGANNLDVLYLTGDNGYQQSQSVPVTDVVKSNPLVSVSFVTCEDNACTKGTPKPISLKAQSWQGAQFRKTVLTMLQSLTIN